MFINTRPPVSFLNFRGKVHFSSGLRLLESPERGIGLWILQSCLQSCGTSQGGLPVGSPGWQGVIYTDNTRKGESLISLIRLWFDHQDQEAEGPMPNETVHSPQSSMGLLQRLLSVPSQRFNLSAGEGPEHTRLNLLLMCLECRFSLPQMLSFLPKQISTVAL